MAGKKRNVLFYGGHGFMGFMRGKPVRVIEKHQKFRGRDMFLVVFDAQEQMVKPVVVFESELVRV